MIPHYILFWAYLLLVCGYALWRGRNDERLAATACLIATIATGLIIPPLATRFRSPDPGLVVIDLAMLAAFTAIALRSKRFWPLWVAGLQLTMTMSHVMKLIDSELIPRVYAVAGAAWSYPILLLIMIGTWRARVPEAAVRGPSPA